MVKMKIMKISKTLQLVEVGVSLQSCLGTSPHTSLGEQQVVIREPVKNVLAEFVR